MRVKTHVDGHVVEDGRSRVVAAGAVEPDGWLSPMLLTELARPDIERLVLCADVAGHLVGETSRVNPTCLNV